MLSPSRADSFPRAVPHPSWLRPHCHAFSGLNIMLFSVSGTLTLLFLLPGMLFPSSLAGRLSPALDLSINVTVSERTFPCTQSQMALVLPPFLEVTLCCVTLFSCHPPTSSFASPSFSSTNNPASLAAYL